MEGKKLLHRIRLKNLLSYGRQGELLDLQPLNVLIGPNASGKSNLIEAISLLAAAPRDLMVPIREGGGTSDWLWKGGAETPIAEILVRTIGPDGILLFYLISFTATDHRLMIVDENISDSVELILERGSTFSEPRTGIPWDKIDSHQSLLSQIRNPESHPELTYIGDQFREIRIFRGWSFGTGSVLRRPQDVNLPDDFLLEDGSNLGLILNDLQNRRETKRLLVDMLRLLYEGVEDVTTKVQGGTIQIFFHEHGLDRPVPAARLSDGTLHYLCLLTVLLHPDPPPLICIEEPEVGMHPDVIRTIAKLLIDASQRTQLIVTTHSETLVSALSEVPESIVVCERDQNGTQLTRLEPAKLEKWLGEYRLGELWAMGEIGGNR